MNIILYSTGCPRCKVLESKLDNKKIPYLTMTDRDRMLAMGLDEMPVLEVDGKRMNFAEAIKWANQI